MFSKQLIKDELIKDVRSRAKGSAIGNIFLSFVFLAISHSYLIHFKIFTYIAVVSIFVNIARVVCSKKIAYMRFTDSLTIAAGICWGSLFCIVYLNTWTLSTTYIEFIYHTRWNILVSYF